MAGGKKKRKVLGLGRVDCADQKAGGRRQMEAGLLLKGKDGAESG